MNRELLLLGILRQQGMHGYQLAEFIEHNLGSCTDLKKPTAYFLLEKMAAAGWIRYEHGQEGHRPPRRVYHLTGEGEAAFQRLLRQSLSGYTPLTFGDDVGLAFLQTLSPAEAAGLLRHRRAALTAHDEKLSAAPQHPGPTHWIVEHQQRHVRAEIAWVDELIARLETSTHSQPT